MDATSRELAIDDIQSDCAGTRIIEGKDQCAEGAGIKPPGCECVAYAPCSHLQRKGKVTAVISSERERSQHHGSAASTEGGSVAYLHRGRGLWSDV